MSLIHGIFILWITMILFIHNVEGRYHHKKPKKTSPAPSDPSPPSPSFPSDPYPYPNDPGESPSNCVFDVRSFGAVGDGDADDTAAFRAAWKAACAVDSGVLLAPENYCFKITSTIFSGPCKPGLVFQVRMLLQFPCSSHKTIFSLYKYVNMVQNFFYGRGCVHPWYCGKFVDKCG